MSVNLIKKYTTTKNQKFVSEITSDMTTIEKAINSVETNIESHKKAKSAHSSEQIKHGGLTVYDAIKEVNALIHNLVLEADGTNIKEVLMARVNKKAVVFPDLKARLDNSDSVQEELSAAIQKEYEFDYTTIPPVYHTTLSLADKTVLQWFGIDEETGDIYATQVSSGNTEGSESFTITRMNQNGLMLDSMKVDKGGHGTTLGLEREGGKVYIWSNYDVVDSNGNTVGNDLVRFPYTAGVTLNSGSGGIRRYNKFNDYYTIPVTDTKNGLIAFRIKLNDGNSVVELRKLSDVKNNINNVLGTVTIPKDLVYLQGLAIDGYDLYWYTGDTNNKTYPNELCRFSFKDGKLTDRISCNFGYDEDGKYEDNFREPESVCFYKDPKTGKKSLLAGVVTGGAGKRINKVYAYHSKENAAKFGIDLSQGYQGYSLTQSNGKGKRLPDSISNLKDYRKVGSYYMYTTETTKLKDHPSPGDAGWWLNIDAADPSGTVIQTLRRNSTGRDIKIYTRVVTNKGVAGNWVEVMTGQRLSWSNVPLKNGASNPDSSNKLEYAINGGTLFIRGRVNIPKTDGVVFALLPAGARPSKSWYEGCQVGGTTGDRKIGVLASGEMVARGFAVNSTSNVTYTYINLTVPLS
ncbi:teichoic acid biosynthesis protein [Bacillus subtilis]|uniref:Teichoic acid biosynthesis protein n=1 Tax=Bacillus subtilis TaxID=1423 RepID=A0A8I2BAU6_BACIU|nr:teichoic acid biosynthesis protein [Bacillus subtilis]MBO3796843.1 teichoic acid biosynthesis protein [Bacillus subtilis]